MLSSLLLAWAVLTGGGDLVAGRPGWTEARGTVTRGASQFEGGWARTMGAGRASDLGSVLRVGLTPRTELRIATAGPDEVQVGAKFVVAHHDRGHFELAVTPSLVVPASSHHDTPAVLPGAGLSVAYTLPLAFDAGAQVKAWRTRVAGQRATEYSGSVLVSHALPFVLSGFGEAYVVSSADGQNVWTIDAGLSRVVSRRAQVDVEVSRTIRALVPTWSVGLGVVIARSK